MNQLLLPSPKFGVLNYNADWILHTALVYPACSQQIRETAEPVQLPTKKQETAHATPKVQKEQRDKLGKEKITKIYELENRKRKWKRKWRKKSGKNQGGIKMRNKCHSKRDKGENWT